MLLYDRPEPLKRCAMVLSSVRFIKEECSISASQEHLLNSIPGWEDSNVNADFTPDELQLSAPQVHAARSVSSSSTDSATYHYGDLESQDWVEWGSPDDSFNGAFESDRDQSPRRESFSTNLFNEQSAQSHVPGSQVDELNQSAAIPLAQACDAEDPADMPRAQNCLSPRRSEGGQKFSTEAQFRAATDLSPTRNVSALRFPVSTGSASSLDRLANHSNSTASPCASPSASEDPNRRPKKRQTPVLDHVDQPQDHFYASSTSRQVKPRSPLLAHREQEKYISYKPIENSAHCARSTVQATVSGSTQVSALKVVERDDQVNSRTCGKWLRHVPSKPCGMMIETIGQAPEVTTEEVPRRLELRECKQDVEVDASEPEEEPEVSPSKGVINAEAAFPKIQLDGCRSLEGSAGDVTEKLIDEALPRAAILVETGTGQEQFGPAPGTRKNRQIVSQSYAEGSQQAIEAKQCADADGDAEGGDADRAWAQVSCGAGSSFSFEARDTLVDFDTPDLFGQLGKNYSQPSHVGAPTATTPSMTGITQSADPKPAHTANLSRSYPAPCGLSPRARTPKSGCPVSKAAHPRISPKSVMEVVREFSGEIMCTDKESCDLLSTALQSGLSLPLPFQRRYPFS